MSRSGCIRLCEPDYSSPHGWEERLYFWGINNKELLKRTGGKFAPRDPEGSHPAFILRKIATDAFQLCPCSSDEHRNLGKASYIRKDARTTPSRFYVKKNTFILHFLSFNLLASDRLADRIPVHGLVSEDDIVGEFHRQGGAQ